MNFALSVLLLTAGAPLPPPPPRREELLLTDAPLPPPRREEDTSRTDEVLPPFAPWPAGPPDLLRANSIDVAWADPDDRPRNRRERREMKREARAVRVRGGTR